MTVKHITSDHNETFKHLKQLAKSAKRRKLSSETLLEGIHLCESYLESGGQPIAYIYTDSELQNPEVATIIDLCNKQMIPGILLSKGKFQLISSVQNSVGIAFVIPIPSKEPMGSLTSDALLLEDVQDPGNMGAILRTAAAAGIRDVFTSSGSTSAWSPKVLRGGMGAHNALNIYEGCDLAELINNAKVQVLATILEAKHTIYEKNLSEPTAWLFGNEGQGVSSDLLSLNIDTVVIPQSSGVESLNIAASVAVCLFEQVRQSKHAGLG